MKGLKILLVQESSRKVLFFLYFLKTFIEQFLETEFSLAFFFINIRNSDMLLSVTGKVVPQKIAPKISPLGQDQRMLQVQGQEQSSGGQSSKGQLSQYRRYLSSDKKSFVADKIINKPILFQHYDDGVIVCHCFHCVSFLL